MRTRKARRANRPETLYRVYVRYTGVFGGSLRITDPTPIDVIVRRPKASTGGTILDVARREALRVAKVNAPVGTLRIRTCMSSYVNGFVYAEKSFGPYPTR